MAKVENVTREALVKQKEILHDEVTRLQKIIDASSETTFDIIIEDLKEQMHKNIDEEDWGEVKSCIKEVDNVNGTRKFISKQASLLSKKKDELADITDKIEHYQPSLFDEQQEKPSEEYTPILQKEGTGIYDNEGSEFMTGDIYKSKFIEDGEYYYYFILRSTEKEGSFAIISNTFAEERLLQYPKNIELLNDAQYVGNRFEPEGDKQYKELLEIEKIIFDSRDINS